MHSKQLVAIAATAACVAAQTSSSTSSAADAGPTEVTGCHSHGEEGLFCFEGSEEWEVTSPEYIAENLPDSFDNCHFHAGVLHCDDGDKEATFASASASSEEEHDHDHDHAEEASSTASTGAASTMATSASSTATGSSNSTSSTATSASSSLPTAVTACHTHGETELFCMAGRDEWEVISEWDAENPPRSFPSCHPHGEELHCVDGDVDATLVAASEEHSHGESGTASDSGSGSSTTESDKAETSSAESDDSASAATVSSKIGQAGVLLSACLLAYAAYAF